jgi:hypothetical protein
MIIQNSLILKNTKLFLEDVKFLKYLTFVSEELYSKFEKIITESRNRL